MNQELIDIVVEWLDNNLLEYDFGEIGTKNRLLEDLSNYLKSYDTR